MQRVVTLVPQPADGSVRIFCAPLGVGVRRSHVQLTDELVLPSPPAEPPRAEAQECQHQQVAVPLLVEFRSGPNELEPPAHRYLFPFAQAPVSQTRINSMPSGQSGSVPSFPWSRSKRVRKLSTNGSEGQSDKAAKSFKPSCI